MADRSEYIPAPLYDEEEILAWEAKRQQETNAINAASRVIYEAVSNWSGVEVGPDNRRIPIVRQGKVIAFRGTLITDPVAPIISAAGLRSWERLQEEKEQLTALVGSLLAVREKLERLDIAFSGPLRRSWETGGHGYGLPVDVVHAIGMDRASLISLHGICRNATDRLAAIERDLAGLPNGPGRPPNRPAYEVAREFALLYGAVTGKRPSCSVSRGIPSGPFAPRLEALFGALGWKETGIRGPGREAVLAVTDEYIRSFENSDIALPAGFWGFR